MPGQIPVQSLIRVPIGAYGGGGPYHSGSIESTLLTIRGIKVVYPSNAADMKGLMKAAFLDPNPVVMLEHKGLYWSKVAGTEDAKTVEPDEDYILPLGKANVVQHASDEEMRLGNSMTVITYGMGKLRKFQYAKINPDYRRYIPLGGQRYFVYRFNAGVASPLFGSDVIPYDKYFFAGGASSVRAWTARRLGPGSHFSMRTVMRDGEEVLQPYSPEQPGEVMLETSAEYRFNMVGFLNGAVFVDAGNVWMLRPDNRPGSDFAFNRFYKELAVGTGFGLRLNFSVVILRFDFAAQVYDPAGDSFGNKLVIRDFRFSDFFRQTDLSNIRRANLNIGIGYPF